MKKRIVSMMLAVAMVSSFVACGDTSENPREGSATNSEVREFEIFAGVSSLSPDNSEKPIIQEMNEAMDVEVTWNCVAGDALVERKNLVLNAGSDLPDAFMGAGLSDYEIITNGEYGVFVALEDYINPETMPNLSAIVADNPDVLAAVTMPDGHIYTLPTIVEMGFEYSDGNNYYIGAIPQFVAINSDWLEAVNMEMPTTIEGLHDVLVAFRDNDVNGNGDPSDEIPLSFQWDHWCANMGSLFSAFGFTGYNADHRAIEDGTVYFQANTDEYKEAMLYFSEWYQEGLIDIEAFSQDDSQYIAKGSGTDPRLGVFSWWEIPEVVGEHADQYEYLTFLSSADGTLGVNLNEQGTISRDRFAMTNACENPELLMQWVDQFYDPTISMQAIYGPIGEYFEAEPDENGVYKETAEAGGDMKARTEIWAPIRQLSSDFGTYYYMEDRAMQRLEDLDQVWFENVDDFNYYPSVVFTVEETELINDKMGDIKEYVSETSANWLIYGGVEETWDEYVAQLEAMGVNEVVAAWQAAYDRYEAAK